MAAERRNQVILGALVVVLIGAVYRAVAPSPDLAPPPAAGAPPAARAPTRGGAPANAMATVAAPDVRLEALDRHPEPASGNHRNPFEFGARPAPEAARTEPGRLPPPPVSNPAPTAVVPTVPPIGLKFIGVVQATEQSQTYAVLRDDRGVYHGREGDIIEGRYRILKIGVESIELSYVDGQGRQTIRLGS
jgi:hypothetical protein